MTSYFKRKELAQALIKRSLKASQGNFIPLPPIYLAVEDSTQLGSVFVNKYISLLESTGYVEQKNEEVRWIQDE